MADYQYQPSPDNEIVKLIEGLQNVDCEWQYVLSQSISQLTFTTSKLVHR
jgi:hypothetical protein